jgi:uncharacterized protein YidB (DUF937 family)
MMQLRRRDAPPNRPEITQAKTIEGFMGLLDSVSGMLGGNAPGGASSAALVQQIAQMLAGSGGNGGLAELVQSFDRSGLGHVIASWVGTGHNLPISPEQLQQVLGQSRIGQIAQSLGLQPEQISAQLSQLLPHAVDKVTPGGEIPSDGVTQADVAQTLSSMLGQLGGSNASGGA